MSDRPKDPMLAHVRGRIARVEVGLRATERERAVNNFRDEFVNFVETFLERRRGVTAENLEARREEYRELHRRVVRAYRPVRDLYHDFIREEPAFDRRREIFEDGGGFSVDYPVTQYWGGMTFDEQVANWQNADDDHIRRHFDRQLAVLDALQDWAAEERPDDASSYETPEAAPRTTVEGDDSNVPRTGIGQALNHPWVIAVASPLIGAGIIALLIWLF